jgi:urate oxidase / 2-oxo-4-hydroxy-4-carboxy-5-ureidoimidazoline decarboxylase
MAEPVTHAYGKDAVSVYRTDGERLFACEVRLIARSSVLESSYTEGDNSRVVATDSMKNFIHRTALAFEGYSLEDFALEIGRRFLERYDHLEAAELRVFETAFAKRGDGLFQRLYDDRGVVEMFAYDDGTHLERSSRRGLHLVKLTGSSFADFVRDEYTTLPDARDRPLFVHMDVSWHNADHSRRADGEAIRQTIIDTFAGFDSASIQHLVHEIGVRILDRHAEVDNVAFRAENRLWDKAEQGGGVTVYTDARPPFGEITLSLDR